MEVGENRSCKRSWVGNGTTTSSNQAAKVGCRSQYLDDDTKDGEGKGGGAATAESRVMPWHPTWASYSDDSVTASALRSDSIILGLCPRLQSLPVASVQSSTASPELGLLPAPVCLGGGLCLLPSWDWNSAAPPRLPMVTPVSSLSHPSSPRLAPLATFPLSLAALLSSLLCPKSHADPTRANSPRILSAALQRPPTAPDRLPSASGGRRPSRLLDGPQRASLGCSLFRVRPWLRSEVPDFISGIPIDASPPGHLPFDSG